MNNKTDPNDFIRKVAVASGAVTVGVGLIWFFFANEATADLSMQVKFVSVFVGFATCYIALKLYFKNKRF